MNNLSGVILNDPQLKARHQPPSFMRLIYIFIARVCFVYDASCQTRRSHRVSTVTVCLSRNDIRTVSYPSIQIKRRAASRGEKKCNT